MALIYIIGVKRKDDITIYLLQRKSCLSLGGSFVLGGRKNSFH